MGVAVLFSVLAVLLGAYALFVVPALLVILVGREWTRGKSRLLRILCLCLCIAAVFRTLSLISEKNTMERLLPEEESACIIGRIEEKSPSSSGQSMRYLVCLRGIIGKDGDFSELSHYGGRIACYTQIDVKLPVGAIIRCHGKVFGFSPPENEGGFDERSYYHALQVYRGMFAEEMVLYKKPATRISETMVQLRMELASFFCQSLPGEEGGILASIVLGERSGLDKDVRDLFSAAGISHLLAVSSLHLSLVAYSLFSVLRSRGISYGLAGACASILAVSYACFTGGSPSAMRAAGMFCLLRICNTFGDDFDLLSSLALMLVLSLLCNPFQIFSLGFLLSYTAVLGIALLASPCGRLLQDVQQLRWRALHPYGRGHDYRQGFAGKLEQSLFQGFLIQLFLFPLLSFFYFKLPVYGIFLNLLVIPLLSPLLFFGILSSILYLVSLCNLAKTLLLPCHGILYLYEALSARTMQLPGAALITGKPSWIQILVFYCVLLLFLPLASRHRTFLHERFDAELPWRHSRLTLFFGTKRMNLAFFGTSFFLILLLALHPKCGFEIDILSVGQGDGIFFSTDSGKTCFIDGGSSSDETVGRDVILPFLYAKGIRKVDDWFITHLDADHYNGFLEVLETGYPVERLVLAESLEKTTVFGELLALCRKHQVEVLYIKTGDQILFEKTGTGRKAESLCLTCLAPDAPSRYSGTNENSLCLLLSCKGFDGVFTGDIGEEQEQALLESGLVFSKSSGRIELLKAAHHGSNYSNSAAWLTQLNPTLAVISAGKNNRYHHPGKAALERLNEAGIPYRCTIDCGQIQIHWEDGKIRIQRWLGG